jgi:hypothetical protein
MLPMRLIIWLFAFYSAFCLLAVRLAMIFQRLGAVLRGKPTSDTFQDELYLEELTQCLAGPALRTVPPGCAVPDAQTGLNS